MSQFPFEYLDLEDREFQNPPRQSPEISDKQKAFNLIEKATSELDADIFRGVLLKGLTNSFKQAQDLQNIRKTNPEKFNKNLQVAKDQNKAIAELEKKARESISRSATKSKKSSPFRKSLVRKNSSFRSSSKSPIRRSKTMM